MFKKILVPTDGSKLSEKAVKRAVQLAKQTNASISAVHVIPKFHTFTYQSDMLELTAKEYEASASAKAKDYLGYVDRVAKAADVKCNSDFSFSDQPFQEIIKSAQKNKCDLIVMASHGRRGLGRLILGSQTSEVLTYSKVPVLVVR